MIPNSEVAVLDRNTEAVGIPTIRLMENAGTALANEILKLNAEGKKVLLLCGKGNNGGDGLVAARHLAEKCSVKVQIFGEEMKSDIAIQNRKRLPESVKLEKVTKENSGWRERISKAVRGADIIVDSMLGVGISGKLRQPYQFAVEQVNNSGKLVVSTDTPTGLGGSNAVKPKLTVTFHDSKPGMEKGCGKVVTADIGIPAEAEKYVGPGEFQLYPIPRENFHKGNNGNVLIVGGGPFTGAPALAGSAALRTGSDLVMVAVPGNVFPIVASMSMDLIVKPLSNPDHLVPEDVPSILELAKRAHAIVIGPGLGKKKGTMEAVKALVERLDGKKLVVDADAIYALKDVKFTTNAVFTPHNMEFNRAKEDSQLDTEQVELTKASKRVLETLDKAEKKKAEDAVEFSAAHGITIVKKGNPDIITDSKMLKFNKTGNAGMTVGGTGDVLSGIIGSLLARGLKPFDAGRLGAYINGRAGDIAFKQKWFSITASDIIQAIPVVFKKAFSKN